MIGNILDNTMNTIKHSAQDLMICFIQKDVISITTFALGIKGFVSPSEMDKSFREIFIYISSP